MAAATRIIDRRALVAALQSLLPAAQKFRRGGAGFLAEAQQLVQAVAVTAPGVRVPFAALLALQERLDGIPLQYFVVHVCSRPPFSTVLRRFWYRSGVLFLLYIENGEADHKTNLNFVLEASKYEIILPHKTIKSK